MRVTFLGTGAAMPHPERVQTGVLIEAAPGDRRPVLVDCGAGILHRLSQTDPGYEAVGTVLLTHHHLDHVADLLPLVKARWLAGEESLSIAGPPGTKQLVDDLLDVHDYLRGRLDLGVREIHPDSTVSLGGMTVTARETRHSVQCLAYRFEPREATVASGGAAGSNGGTSPESSAETTAESGGGASDAAVGDAETGGAFVFSGDSEAFAGLASFADGARVVAHDCSFPDGVDVDNHPTPRQLGKAFAGCDVERLYLTHAYPHTDGKEDEMIASVQESFDGDVRMARDGLRFHV